MEYEPGHTQCTELKFQKPNPHLAAIMETTLGEPADRPCAYCIRNGKNCRRYRPGMLAGFKGRGSGNKNLGTSCAHCRWQGRSCKKKCPTCAYGQYFE